MTQKYISASATVEGALVIPLFVYATVAIIFMLYVFMIRTQVNNALYNTVRKINRYAYISESVQELSDEDKNDIFTVHTRDVQTDKPRRSSKFVH